MNTLLVMVLVCVGQVGGDSGQAEMEALVERIRENLVRVDELLLESADADDVASGIDGVVDSHIQVIRDLESLIKQMKYTPSSSRSSSSSGDESSQESSSQPPPRENDGSQKQPDGEEQPKSPQEQSASESAQEQENEQGAQPKPQDGADEGEVPRSEQGGPPPPDPIGNFTREDSDQRWGLLPPKLQERLLNLHVDDLPEQYRIWLEAYIRRMHSLESSDVR
ncbi:MAG: hypothetical protein P8N09_02425 [Planctomycetota bacterium]|jgi:hypothetical protein|nr:hypothetical protein [Planctomycetota bacterium]